eukprot:COSAG05_NODE_291_length_12036_cov_15.352266_5_plen_112_part_00
MLVEPGSRVLFCTQPPAPVPHEVSNTCTPLDRSVNQETVESACPESVYLKYRYMQPFHMLWLNNQSQSQSTLKVGNTVWISIEALKARMRDGAEGKNMAPLASSHGPKAEK